MAAAARKTISDADAGSGRPPITSGQCATTRSKWPSETSANTTPDTRT
jgi:hypothetical protein